MNCKYCGKKLEGRSAFCSSCGKNIIKQGWNDNNQYAMNNGILYVAPKPENAWESWRYNEMINNRGHF